MKAIILPKELIPSFQWLMLAAAADEQRPPLYNRFLIKKGKAYASDGSRLHRLKIKGFDLPSGLFRVIVNTSESFLFAADKKNEPPNFKKLIPKRSGMKSYRYRNDWHFLPCFISLKLQSVFSFKYIVDATGGGEGIDVLGGDIYWSEPTKPIVIVPSSGIGSIQRLAVVAPALAVEDTHA